MTTEYKYFDTDLVAFKSTREAHFDPRIRLGLWCATKITVEAMEVCSTHQQLSQMGLRGILLNNGIQHRKRIQLV